MLIIIPTAPYNFSFFGKFYLVTQGQVHSDTTQKLRYLLSEYLWKYTIWTENITKFRNLRYFDSHISI